MISDNRPVGANPNTVNPLDPPVQGAAGTVSAEQLAAAEGRVTHSGPISDAAWDTAANEWLNTVMRNSAMSGATEAWNHLNAQLPVLRKLLEAQMGGASVG